MNVVSWENGDKTISDMPACADPMLARIVQNVNDDLCTHRTGNLLCPACSVKVLDLAHRTVGTSGHGLAELDLRRVYVQIACEQAQSVAHLNADPRVQAAIDAAIAWVDGGGDTYAAARGAADTAFYAAYAVEDTAAFYAANTAAGAADTAFYAAYAVEDTAAFYAAKTANAAANAATADAADYADYADYAADAADYAASITACTDQLERAHQVIDRFIELTGTAPAPTPDNAKVTEALRQMAQVAA